MAVLGEKSTAMLARPAFAARRFVSLCGRGLPLSPRSRLAFGLRLIFSRVILGSRH